MTSQEVQYIRDVVNAYSRTADSDCFLDYGDDIEVTDLTPYQINECRVESQLDNRNVVEHEEPYKGSRVPPRTITLPSQVDRWAYELSTLVRGRFQNTSNYLTVPGSEHTRPCYTCGGMGKVGCPSCHAKGYIICPSCHGAGTEKCPSCSDGQVGKRCTSCNGQGQRKVTRSKQEQVCRQEYSSGKTVTRYEYVTKYYDSWEKCTSCNGRGEIFSTCSRCGGSGKLTCKRCKGLNRHDGFSTVTCETCSGTKKVTCKTCEGYETLLHSIRITQTLENHSSSQIYMLHEFWDEVKSMPWRKQCRTETLFEKTDTALSHDLYTQNDSYNDSFNGFLDAHARLESRSCHILFQRATVTRFHLHKVKYNYKGKAYTGYILGNTFHPVNSPIIEYADDLIEGAKSSLKLRSAVDARNKLKEAQALNVAGKNSVIQQLLLNVSAHLNVITHLGLKIMFWLVALFATPLVFQYYDAFNPVLPYASFVNRPDWFGYDLLPVAQCLIFLCALNLSKFLSLETDYSEHDYNHVLMYFGVGMGKIVLAAVVIFAILAVVNYLGMGIITSAVMWLVWWVIKIVFFAIVIIIALIAKLF